MFGVEVSVNTLIEAGGLFLAESLVLLVAAVATSFIIKLVFGRLSRTLQAETVLARLDQLRRLLRIGLVLLVSLGVLALGLFNGWLVLNEKQPLEETIALARSVPSETWAALGLALVKVTVVIFVARMIIRAVVGLIGNLNSRARSWEGIQADGESLDSFFSSLSQLLTNVTWMLVAVFAAREFLVPDGVVALLLKVVNIYLIVGIGLIVYRTVAVIVASVDALRRRYVSTGSWATYADVIHNIIPLFRRCLEYVIVIGAATLVLAQLEPLERLALYGPRLIQAIGIFFIARVVIEAGYLVIDSRKLVIAENDDVAQRRHATMIPLAKTIFRYLVYFIAMVMMLGALGLDIMPFLAGAGILGVVVGLGAQPLINDIVSGFFILFENIYLVGDFIENGETRGTVEQIDFRTTRIRDPEGNLHILRNGDLNHVKNYSKDFTHAVVDVRAEYHHDAEKICALLEQAGEQLAEKMPDIVMEPLLVHGIVDFESSAMRFRTVTRVRPGKHYFASNQLRRIIKTLFDDAGVRMPPEQSIAVSSSLASEAGINRV